MFLRTVLLLTGMTLAASSSALAQERIRYNDLDLNTPAGVASLQNRIASAARRECAGEAGTGSRTTGGSAQCERQMRTAFTNALPAAARARLQPAPAATAQPAQAR